MPEQTELTVVTKAKDLFSYILTVMEPPERFRFTLTSRIQNLSLELIEQINRAHEVYLSSPDREATSARRLDLHRGAFTSVKLLGYMALMIVCARLKHVAETNGSPINTRTCDNWKHWQIKNLPSAELQTKCPIFLFMHNFWHYHFII